MLKREARHNEKIRNNWTPIHRTGPTRRNVVNLVLFYQNAVCGDAVRTRTLPETIEQIVHADTLGFDCAGWRNFIFFKYFSIMLLP